MQYMQYTICNMQYTVYIQYIIYNMQIQYTIYTLRTIYIYLNFPFS